MIQSLAFLALTKSIMTFFLALGIASSIMSTRDEPKKADDRLHLRDIPCQELVEDVAESSDLDLKKLRKKRKQKYAVNTTECR